MKLNGKTVNLVKLGEELTAAGIQHNALGTAGDEIFTYNDKGELVELSAGARVVIDAHVPPPKPPTMEEQLKSTQSAVDFLLMFAQF